MTKKLALVAATILSKKTLTHIQPHMIQSGKSNNRVHYDEAAITELADSMKQDNRGVLQPLIVCPLKSTSNSQYSYEVIAGNRRLKAALQIGLPSVPVVVIEADDLSKRELDYITNLHQTLSTYEKGRAVDLMKTEMKKSLAKWLSTVKSSKKHGSSFRKASSICWDEITNGYRTPSWIIKSVSRAKITGRLPTVTDEDAGARVGLSERQVKYLVQIAELPKKVAQELNAEMTQRQLMCVISLSTRVSTSQGKVSSTLIEALQMSLLRRIADEELSGQHLKTLESRIISACKRLDLDEKKQSEIAKKLLSGKYTLDEFIKDTIGPKPPQSYGANLDFRGLRYAPINEQGVVFLFGMVADELGYKVERVQTGFPDCQAMRPKRSSKHGVQEQVFIEFEFESRNFKTHGHDPKDCNIIVCWRHNWPECPKELEIIQLESEIKKLNKNA